MYTLYYSPGACSMAIHVALNECNQPVKLEKLDMMAGQNRTPEFLKINPLGQVPALIDDGQVLLEGAAQLIHILEKHNSPLLPKSGKERDAALHWLMFCNASLHPAYGRMFFLMKNKADDGLVDTATKMLNKMWDYVEQQLSQTPYLAGEQITMGDILMTVIANWSARMPKPITIGPNTKKMLQKVITRPAYKKALETEQVEYKVAA
jgi:glutathione S-transferase